MESHDEMDPTCVAFSGSSEYLQTKAKQQRSELWKTKCQINAMLNSLQLLENADSLVEHTTNAMLIVNS
jgi:hypothetical protein